MPASLRSATVSPQTGNTLTVATRPTTTSGGTSTTTHPDGTITYTTTSLDRTVVITSSYAKDAVIGTTTPIASTTSTHDSLGRLLTVSDSRTQAAGQTAYSDFTESGTPLTISQGPAGNARVTTITCDILGRVTATTLPDRTSVTHASYDLAGRVKAQWGSMTYPTFSIYNEQGRRIELRTYRDLTGEPTEETGAAVPATEDDPAVPATYSTTTWNYDEDTGRLTSKLDHDSQGPSYSYTPAGRIKTRLWARGRLTTYGYSHGYLTSVIYTGSDPTWQDYLDARDLWETKRNDSNATPQEIAAAETAMNAAYATFAATAEGTPNLDYTYDNFGRIFTVKRAGTLHAQYNYTGFKLTSENLNQDTTVARTLSRHYDALSRPMSLEVSGDYTTGFGYDTAGRLKYVWDHPALDSAGVPVDGVNDPLAGRQFTYNYKGGSYNLLQTVVGPAHTVTNTWEDTRDVLDSKINGITVGTASIPSSYDYAVNALGQRETVEPVVDENGPVSTYKPAWTWGYNARGELVSAADDTVNGQDRGYIYDSIGNRLATGNVYSITAEGVESVTNPVAYTANDLNQYTATPYSTSSPVHDPDGNLTEDRGGNKDSQDRQYVWDVENRLIAVNKVLTRDNDGVITDTTLLVGYQYDHLSRLVVRTTTAAATPEGAATTHYLYDGWNRIAEYSGQTLKRSYTWGMDLSGTMQGAGGVGGLLAVTDEATTGTPVYYPTYDGNGNVSEYLHKSGTTVTVVAHYEYDPFGNIIATLVDEDGNDTNMNFAHRFSTKPVDLVTGLLYYGYRWYDPLTGGWPSRDPIAEQGGLNLYGFVGNDGVNKWDLDGMGWFFCDDCDGELLGTKKAAILDVEVTIGGVTDQKFMDALKKFALATVGCIVAGKIPVDGEEAIKLYVESQIEAATGLPDPAEGIVRMLEYYNELRQASLDAFGREVTVTYQCYKCSCCWMAWKNWDENGWKDTKTSYASKELYKPEELKKARDMAIEHARQQCQKN